MTRVACGEVPREVVAALRAAAEQGGVCTVAGVNCYPPVSGWPHWRVRFGMARAFHPAPHSTPKVETNRATGQSGAGL